MPRQHIEPVNFQLIFQTCAHRRHDLVKHPAHGEHGGATVHRCAIYQDLPHLAAGLICFVNHRHRQTLLRQLQGADQTRHACTNHHHLMISHAQLLLVA